MFEMTGNFKNILAFDTSLGGVSCALYQPDAGRESENHTIMRPMGRGQSEQLVPDLMRLLNFAGIGFPDIDLIVSTVGPGAFTGLRIGLATARALRLSTQAHVIGVNTMDVMARQIQHISQSDPSKVKQSKIESMAETKSIEQYKIAVILETKRRDFYTRLYDNLAQPLTDPTALSGEDIITGLTKHTILAGDGVERFCHEHPNLTRPDYIAHPLTLLDPVWIARTGLNKVNQNTDQKTNTEDVGKDSLLPIYLRGADISKSKKPQRVLGT